MNLIYDTQSPPKIGAVITTSGALPCLHLHLESWQRFGRDTPLLVVVFAKERFPALDALCQKYGADFAYCDKPAVSASLTGIVKGFEWAESKSVELLVRFSDSWVPLTQWTDGLARVAKESQFATFSGGWTTSTPTFTSDVMAFHTRSWRQFAALQILREHADLETPVNSDGTIYQAASDLFEHRCTANTEFCARLSEPLDFDCCGFWPIAGPENRDQRSGALCRNWATAQDYLRSLNQWEIGDYTIAQIESALNVEKEEPPTK